MNAVILTVGDEILIGQIVNTNAAWLGERLGLAGVAVVRMETVGDDVAAIRRALDRALGEADVVVATGGLGPTHDDVTKRAVAEAFGRPLELRPKLMAEVEAKFGARGRPLRPAHRAFAEMPEGFEALPNAKGMAPGLWGEREGGRLVVVLPGVPYEMEVIAEQHVLPRLRARAGGGAVLHKTLLTAGEGETALAERLGDLSDVFGDGVTLAFLPALGAVRLRLSVRGADGDGARTRLDRAAARLRRDLGDLVFGEDAQTLEEVVGAMLAERGLTLGVAESCTGGAVSARITSVPGASRYFRGGVVAYDNAVKAEQLGVEEAVLREHGAVSEATARQMAAGVRGALGADLGLATTGIAGPTGGTPDKPVGLVWLGYADAAGTHAVRLQFTADRAVNIGLSTTAVLNLVRRQLLRKGERKRG